MATIIEKDTAEGGRFFDELKDLVSQNVKVGFLDNGASYEDGESVADVAAFNEYGTSTTPARPFMSNSVELHKDEIDEFTDSLFEQLCNGRITATEFAERLGNFQKDLIKREISEGAYASNAPSTIRKKGSDHPLIDTGLMQESVDYTVGKEGK